MRILVARPEPGASATETQLVALGHKVVRDPVLQIAHLRPQLPEGPFDALAFTSLNGVRAFADHPQGASLAGLPAFAVGSRTAAEARRCGLRTVTDCAGRVEDLAAVLRRTFAPGARILHVAGEERAGDLDTLTAPHGLHTVVTVLYRAIPVTRLGSSTRTALGTGTLDIALHYSPRSAKVLLDLIQQAKLAAAFAALRHLCLSAAVAAPLDAAGFATETAATPNEAALLDLL